MKTLNETIQQSFKLMDPSWGRYAKPASTSGSITAKEYSKLEALSKDAA